MQRAKPTAQFQRLAQAIIFSSLFTATTLAAAPGGSAGGTSVGGGGGGHATAAPAAAPAAHSAPAAPTAASPTANPTTPAGAHETSSIAARQPAANGAAPATDNGASHHHHRDQNQAVYGNSFLPDATGWYGNGDGSYGNTNNNNNGNTNYSTDNSQPAQPAPAPAPVTPSDNATSMAAQTDNAINQSPAMVSVSDAVSHAQAAFDADRQRVLTQLAQKPEYQQAMAKQKDAAKDMSDVKPLGAGTPANQTPAPAVMNAAEAKLDASDDVTKMQEQAIAADPQAVADKERLTKLEAERDTQQARMRSQH